MLPALHTLLPLDPRSRRFAEVFQALLSSKDERTDILALSGKDAELVIEIIDRACLSRTFLGACSLIFSLSVKALRAARLETGSRHHALRVLGRLCGKVGYLPESYLLPDEFHPSGSPCASGGFADVWMGAFKGKNVAIKTLRVSQMNKAGIRKVGNKTTSSYLGSLMHSTALL